MTARASQVRTYRILGCLAVLHSGVVLAIYFGAGAAFDIYRWSGLWIVLTSSLFLWLLVLAIHPGRSTPRFLIPAIIAAALFVPCASEYGFLIRHSVFQWRAASKLEKLLRSSPRMVLYSIDPMYRTRLELRKGYRQVRPDEIILPDDLFDNAEGSFVRMGEDDKPMIVSIANSLGKTVNSIAEEDVRSGYGKDWQLLRKEPSGSTESEPEKETPAVSKLNEFEREPYKRPNVSGYAEITDPAEQRALITALARSARYASGGALCHIPRHGLYVETATSTVVLSICFECENLYVFGPDSKTGRLTTEDSFAITRAPASLFDAALKQHGVPVAPVRAR
jgi:hypothetical protein